MADPLSVAASIAGLLSAAGSVAKVLGPYVAAARDTPKIAAEVSGEVHAATIILSALQKLAGNLSSVPTRRAALVRVDQVVTVLTNGVLIFSELEASVGSLSLAEPSVTPLALRFRLQWARKETELTRLLTRLQGFKLSISLILTIIQRHVGCFGSCVLLPVSANLTRFTATPTHRLIGVKWSSGITSTNYWRATEN
jgi:cell division control protein 24